MMTTCAAYQAWEKTDRKEKPCSPCAQAVALRKHAEDSRRHADAQDAAADRIIAEAHRSSAQ